MPAVAAVPARRPSRAAGSVLATLAVLALTAASAAVTVAVGKPDERPSAAAAPLPAASSAASSAPASASAAARPGAAASPSPLLTLAPPPAPGPRPATTLHGSVDGGTHGGDLRYFFVPVPEDAEPYGSADGFKLTDEELVAEYGQKDIIAVLNSYGFKQSVERMYRTADGRADVRIRLVHFSSASNAAEFVTNANYKADESFDVAGVAGARGFLFKAEQKAFTGELVAIASKGDVEIEIEIEAKGDLDKGLLADVMKRQSDRLSSGG